MKSSREQQAYAGVLDILVKIGFAGLLLSFAVYVLRLIPPFLDMSDLAALWHLPLREFLAQTGAPSRPWEWVHFIGFGDIINYVPVVFMGSVSLICLARVLPILIKSRDLAYSLIVAIQILVIAVAASGILAGGPT